MYVCMYVCIYYKPNIQNILMVYVYICLQYSYICISSPASADKTI